MTEQVLIRFLRTVAVRPIPASLRAALYHRGDTAAFPPAVAAELVEAGDAELMPAKQVGAGNAA
jgi:hypothetical protein